MIHLRPVRALALLATLAVLLGPASASARILDAASFARPGDRDQTAALQRAIDAASNDRQNRDVVLVKNRQPTGRSDWWQIRPIEVRRPVILRLADNVRLQAAEGAFRGAGDCLLTLTRDGITIEGAGIGKSALAMRRDDYLKEPYSTSQFRHAIRANGVRDLTIRDLSIWEAGGDGILVTLDDLPGGTGRNFCQNVRIDRVDCAYNTRQGMSVTSVRGLWVTRSKFRGTRGLAPQAGVDLEPSNELESLDRIFFEDCNFDDNAGTGIKLELYAHHNKRGTDDPNTFDGDNPNRTVFAEFRDCTSLRNGKNGIQAAGVPDVAEGLAVRGQWLFRGVRIENSGEHGINLQFNLEDKDNPELNFAGVTVKDSGRKGGPFAGVFFANNNNGAQSGGFDFGPWEGVACSVADDRGGPLVLVAPTANNYASTVGWRNITGVIDVPDDRAQSPKQIFGNARDPQRRIVGSNVTLRTR